jgi:2-dehydropantoate 2-reductase
MANRYAFIGCGGVGGFYGGRLLRAGAEVHFLVRHNAAEIRRNGLTVDSPEGGFSVREVSAFDRAADMPRCETVVVTIKTTGNDAVPAMLESILAPGGTVVLLQNGMGEEEKLARHVAAEQIVGGLAFLCSTRVAPGHIRHDAYGHMEIGRFDPEGQPAGVTERLRGVAAGLTGAGLKVKVVDDLHAARWKKVAWNIPFSGLSVLLDTETETLVNDPACRTMVESLMREVMEAARRCARPLAPDLIERMIGVTGAIAAYWPSMYLDCEAGRPMELESIFREPIRRARAKGLVMTGVELLANALEFKQRERSAKLQGYLAQGAPGG